MGVGGGGGGSNVLAVKCSQVKCQCGDAHAILTVFDFTAVAVDSAVSRVHYLWCPELV